jgi:hypothetical protein
MADLSCLEKQLLQVSRIVDSLEMGNEVGHTVEIA